MKLVYILMLLISASVTAQEVKKTITKEGDKTVTTITKEGENTYIRVIEHGNSADVDESLVRESMQFVPYKNVGNQGPLISRVSYYTRIYRMSGYSFAKSLSGHYDKPTKGTLIEQINKELAKLVTAKTDLEVVFPGEEFSSTRKHFGLLK